MSDSVDVVVVGAGLSGLMTALLTAHGGAHVMLLARGVGNTHTGSGCIGVLGYTPLGTPVSSPSRVLTRSLKNFPTHPYFLAGRDALTTGMDALTATCRVSHHELVGDLRANYSLPSPLGGKIPACMVPASMAGGHQEDGDEQPWLLVGIAGWRDFDASYAAANLGEHVDAVDVVLPADWMNPNISVLDLARRFDEPGLRALVASQLVDRLGEATRIGFPALLGLRYSDEAVIDLSERLGRPVFEVLTVPPSLPGLRLYEALRVALQALHVEIVMGPTVRGWMERDQLQGVRIQANGRERHLKAGHVVLASGGILGGGLQAQGDGSLHETVFDLPVETPAHDTWFDDLFVEGQHRIFDAGIKVNSWMQPVDAAGEVVSTRLYAVGGLLAAPDRIGMHAAQGIDLATAAKTAEVITQ